MRYIAYLFELKSIQQYLMAGGKLKQMINASDLLEQVTSETDDQGELGGWLDITLEAAGLTDKSSTEPLVTFSRRSGGVIYLFAAETLQEKLENFRRVWTLLIQQLLPDCEFIDCITPACASAIACVNMGRSQLLQQRNTVYPALPPATPMTRIAPRTGTAAVKKGPDEWMDKASLRKTRFTVAKSNLTRKFDPDTQYQWPSSLEKNDFPYLPGHDERDVAIIHIDGNGLGQILISIQEVADAAPDGYTQLYSTFSKQLKESVEAAAREATKTHLIPHADDANRLPARPLVLGGDDLTIIVRADLAIAFSHCFIKSFERHTARIKQSLRKLPELKDKVNDDLLGRIPDCLTACGGIVFLKANQPFMMGYELAESLCAQAKQDSKSISQTTIPSSLCFYQLQASITNNYSQIFDNELTTASGDHYLTLGSYSLGEYQALAGKGQPALPSLERLCLLSNLFQEPATEGIKAKLRQWVGLMLLDKNAADEFREQFEQQLTKQAHSKLYAEILKLQQELLDTEQTEWHWFNNRQQSPLVDLITLVSLKSEHPGK